MADVQAPPLTVEEALTLPDGAASAMPDRVRIELATQRLYISGSADASFATKPGRVHGGWSLPLPAGAAVGLAGRELTRVGRSSVALDDVAHTEPHRPPGSA
jgi:hypothetical protein